MLSDRIRGDRHKLKHRWFPLNIRKHFSNVMVTNQWNRLSIEAVMFPSLKILESHLDMVLGSLLWMALPEKGSRTRWPREVPSSLNHSVILLWERSHMSVSKKSCGCESVASLASGT